MFFAVKKKNETVFILTVFGIVFFLSVAESSLYASCLSGCDDPSSPCSANKQYLVQGSKQW